LKEKYGISINENWIISQIFNELYISRCENLEASMGGKAPPERHVVEPFFVVVVVLAQKKIKTTYVHMRRNKNQEKCYNTRESQNKPS
jgi:hypothetical protein